MLVPLKWNCGKFSLALFIAFMLDLFLDEYSHFPCMNVHVMSSCYFIHLTGTSEYYLQLEQELNWSDAVSISYI